MKLSNKEFEEAQKSKLQSLHKGYERYAILRCQFQNLKRQHFCPDLVNKIRVSRENISNSKVVHKILRTIPMKFDRMLATKIESHDTDTM